MTRILAGLLVVLVLVTLAASLRSDPAPRRVLTVGGVTYLEGECYVEGSSILCRGPIG